MPGFIIGGSGEPANSKVESRRKHRWRFTTIAGGDLASNVAVYLFSAQRPHLTVDPAEMHHDQEVATFAGKHHWEPINLVFYDISGDGVDTSKEMWAWIQNTIDIPGVTVSAPNDYKKDSKLELTDGQGNANETWDIYNCWPIDTNWNDLDYSASDIQTVDVSMKYDRAVRG